MKIACVTMVIAVAASFAACSPPASSSTAAAAASSAPAPAWSRVVDLGHPLAATDPSWDGTPVFSWKPAASFAKEGYFAGQFSTEEHFGTHLDAPAHFAKDGLTVDRIPADRLVRPAIVIDVSAQASRDEDYRVTVADIQQFEVAHGAIPADSVVLIATGWDARWPDAARYMNVRAGVKHFPGLSVDAARVLAADRKVAGIGIDTASIDYGPSEHFEAHQTTMPLGVYHVENVTRLSDVPPTGATVVIAPIKIAGGSGGPARVFALVR